MPHWNVLNETSIISTQGGGTDAACRGKDQACKGSRFYGLSEFNRADKKAVAHFTLIGYKNEGAAEAGYDTLWKVNGIAAGPDASKLELESGDRSTARIGRFGGAGEQRAVVQLRLGANLAWVHLRSTNKDTIDEQLVKDLASVFTDRIHQAQSGETPSASLN